MKIFYIVRRIVRNLRAEKVKEIYIKDFVSRFVKNYRAVEFGKGERVMKQQRKEKKLKSRQADWEKIDDSKKQAYHKPGSVKK